MKYYVSVIHKLQRISGCRNAPQILSGFKPIPRKTLRSEWNTRDVEESPACIRSVGCRFGLGYIYTYRILDIYTRTTHNAKLICDSW